MVLLTFWGRFGVGLGLSMCSDPFRERGWGFFTAGWARRRHSFGWSDGKCVEFGVAACGSVCVCVFQIVGLSPFLGRGPVRGARSQEQISIFAVSWDRRVVYRANTGSKPDRNWIESGSKSESKPCSACLTQALIHPRSRRVFKTSPQIFSTVASRPQGWCELFEAEVFSFPLVLIAGEVSACPTINNDIHITLRLFPFRKVKQEVFHVWCCCERLCYKGLLSPPSPFFLHFLLFFLPMLQPTKGIPFARKDHTLSNNVFLFSLGISFTKLSSTLPSSFVIKFSSDFRRKSVPDRVAFVFAQYYFGSVLGIGEHSRHLSLKITAQARSITLCLHSSRGCWPDEVRFVSIFLSSVSVRNAAEYLLPIACVIILTAVLFNLTSLVCCSFCVIKLFSVCQKHGYRDPDKASRSLTISWWTQIRNMPVPLTAHIQSRMWTNIWQNMANFDSGKGEDRYFSAPCFCSCFCFVCGGWGSKKFPNKLRKHVHENFRCFFASPSTWIAEPNFGDFNGFPPDSRRLSSDFDRFSVIFTQFQSASIDFNQFQSVWLGQKRWSCLTTGRWGKNT